VDPHNQGSNRTATLADIAEFIQLIEIKNSKPNLKLPEFSIPKFDGKVDNWEKFRDSFEALISKTKLSGVEKLLYLNNCCEGGEAANVLAGFEVSEENFALAWEDLKGRYNNDRVLVDKHFSELLKCKPVSKDNPEDLKRLYDCFSVRIKQLVRSVPDDKTRWELMMVHLVAFRLDFDNRKSWETKLKKNVLPSWEMMENFLDEKCRVLAQIGANSRVPSISKSTISRNNLTISGHTKNAGTPFKATTSLVVTDSGKLKCRLCGNEHFTYQCSILTSNKNVHDRIAKVKSKNLCFNCLKSTHLVQL
jgi:hypothetical protein